MHPSAANTMRGTVEEWIDHDAAGALLRYHILGESLYTLLRTTANSRCQAMLDAMHALPPFSTIPVCAMAFPAIHPDVIAARERFERGEWSIDEAFVSIGGDIDAIDREVQS